MYVCKNTGPSLVQPVQWSALHAPRAGRLGLSHVQAPGSHVLQLRVSMPQLRSLHALVETWLSPINTWINVF